MILRHIFHRIAFLATALINLWWNDLIPAAVTVARACLSSPGQSVVQRVLKLHSLVLIFFVLGFCFHTVTAISLPPGQATLRQDLAVLNFDHIETPDGFGTIPTPYHDDYVFNGFFAFDPSHPLLGDVISPQDLNCAVSKPNALYGTRDNFKSAVLLSATDRKPSIQPSNSTRTFTIHRLKIKPLNMPLGAATVNLEARRRSLNGSDADALLRWNVDFPAGFHDTLDVRVREFSGISWDRLEVLYIWADFHYNGLVLDWEFCLDDMEVEMD